jgi:pimeloyl-ACP methyl ester carboxylesterase
MERQVVVSTGRIMKRTALALATAVLATAGSTTVADAVPDGALPGYYGQHLAWRSCQQDASDEGGKALDRGGARCAPVRVPIDYERPAGGALTVWISRITATDTAHRIGPLVLNLGGPGIPVLGSVLDAAAAMGATGARFDLIGMDVRFTGRSTPVDCDWPSTWIPRSAGTDRASFDRIVALSADLAHRCAAHHGQSPRDASTANAARDLDIVRAALGEPSLSFLGYSYGSFLGASYAQLFPRRTNRIVLDSAIDPADAGIHVRGDNGPVREAALREWETWAAAHDPDYHLGTSQTAVSALIDRIYRTAAHRPLRIGQHPVDDTVLPALLVDPLGDDGDASNDQLARFVRTLADALTGQTIEPDPDLSAVLDGILTGANSTFHSGQTAISCADQRVPRDIEWYWRDLQHRQAEAPLFGGLNRVSPCIFLPAAPVPPTIGNPVPALIVHADGDINATAELNQAMHRALTGSRLITLDHVRTHGVYLFRGAACVDDAVNTYLDTGILPTTDQHCAE